MNILYVIIMFFVIAFIELISRNIYCIRKKKNNNRKKCLYWDCPKYNACEYNGVE